MFPQSPSLTEAWTLKEVVARLSAHEAVAGIVLLGSTGNESHTAYSDYDLLLVMREMSLRLYIVFTTIDGRLADIIFSDTQFIDQLLTAAEPMSDEPSTGLLRHWLQNGRVVYDSDGQIHVAQSKIKADSWLNIPDDKAVFAVWKGIHYNCHQTKRMLAADEEVYQTAVDLRLTYMIADVWLGYFTVRRLPWQGEKKAVRYWQTHDPAFLILFQQYAAASNRAQRFALYTELAQGALDPIGGLTLVPQTLITLQSEAWAMADLEQAATFWGELLGQESEESIQPL